MKKPTQSPYVHAAKEDTDFRAMANEWYHYAIHLEGENKTMEALQSATDAVIVCQDDHIEILESEEETT